MNYRTAPLPTTTTALREGLPLFAPELLLEGAEDPYSLPSLWPNYAYGISALDQQVWAIVAEYYDVRFIPGLAGLEYIRQSLNPGSDLSHRDHEGLARNPAADEVVEKGILYYALHGEGTLDRKIGVSYQLAECSPWVHLVTPSTWFKLYELIYPFKKFYSVTAARHAASYTTHADQVFWEAVPSIINRRAQMYERGISSGVPGDTPISQEAFSTVPIEWMQARHIIPFKIQDNELYVFSSVPDNQYVNDLVRTAAMPVQLVYMDPNDETQFWATYHASLAL